MLTVTFYSFRGGVGRTMALANVAVHLSREGLNVFLIDFDLEAPGLSLMPELQCVDPPAANEGLIGYLRAGLEDRQLPAIESLCYETQLSFKLREEEERAGTVHILPAGTSQGANRQQDLAHLHLEKLYDSQPRSLVIDALKVQIEQRFAPDYVLVDSRTGFTDVGGICTVHLADLLVIVSGLNRQNVDGTSIVVRNLNDVRKGLTDNVLFVISPVPIGEEKLKAERLSEAARQFAEATGESRDLSGQLITIPYHPQIALTEDNFVFHHPQSPLAVAFRGLAETIRERNPDDLRRLLSMLLQRIQRGDNSAIGQLKELAERPDAPRDARYIAALFHHGAGDFDSAARLLERTVQDDPQDHDSLNLWGTVLSDQAKTKSGAEADALFDQAGQKYEAALKIKPDFHEALYNWGNALYDQAKTKSGAEADALFDQAGQKYEAALKIKPDKHEALFNWGNAIYAQAETKSGAEANALFDQAGQKYEAALKIKPDDHQALNYWGNALSDQAKTKSGAEADALFDQAGQKYEAALKIKPDKHEALYNWGKALSDQAKTKSGAEADALFDQAGQKFEAALDIESDDHEAFSNWGVALSAQARTKTGAEADALFVQAGQKFEAALKIKPDYHEALRNWGIALSVQAGIKSGAEADALFDQAGQKYEAALKIKLDEHRTFHAWGLTLSAEAKTKSGAEADALFDQAGQEYEAALKIKPDDHEALNNWGNALVEQAKTKTGEEAERLFAQAGEKLLAAEQLSEGSAAYKLACLAALRVDREQCRHWLEKSQAAGTLPSRSHMEQDSDLDSVREEEWFQPFVDSLAES